WRGYRWSRGLHGPHGSKNIRKLRSVRSVASRLTEWARVPESVVQPPRVARIPLEPRITRTTRKKENETIRIRENREIRGLAVDRVGVVARISGSTATDGADTVGATDYTEHTDQRTSKNSDPGRSVRSVASRLTEWVWLPESVVQPPRVARIPLEPRITRTTR